MFRIQAFLIAVMVFIGAAQHARAEVETHLGPLAEVVDLGDDGTWNAGLLGGWFMLTNRSDPNALRFYHVTRSDLAGGERILRVNVAVRADGPNRVFGGIIFDYEENGSYFGFTIASDGKAVLLVRDKDGLQSFDAENAAARLDGSDILEVRSVGRKATFHLNDALVFEVETGAAAGNSLGILAAGQGRFGFDKLTIAETAAADPFPQPGGDGTFPAPADQNPFPTPGGTTTGGTTPGNGGQQAEQPQADQPVSPQDAYAAQVIMGTTFGVFFHEFAHALIGETKLPATGPEEDTADGFSQYLLASMANESEGPEHEREFLFGIARNASLLWYHSARNNEQRGNQHPWQDEHAPDIKRFRNSFCILYGSNPQRYEQLANRIGLEERTRARCLHDYPKRYQAWETILKTVSRNLGPDLPGDLPANAPGGKVVLTIQPGKSQIAQVVVGALQHNNTMATILDAFSQIFVWPRDLHVEFRDCERINAWYDPGEGKITMCYSAIEYFSNVVFNGEAGQPGAGQPTGQPGGQPTGQPANQPTGQDATTYLVGSWQATIPIDGGQIFATAIYDQQGQFRLDMNAPFGASQTIGTWQAEVTAQNQILLSSNPTQWSPQQFCDGNGYCQPNVQQPEQIVVTVIDQNTVSVDNVQWRRTQ